MSTARLATEEQGANVPLPAVFSQSDVSTLETEMAYKSYYEKLRDPRWQKRRLEIMSLAEFKCSSCEAHDKTLNVHHKLYRKRTDPWDYSDEELVCLCEDCHEREHGIRSRLDVAIASLDPFHLEQITGFAEGLAHLMAVDFTPEKELSIFSIEHAEGLDAALKMDTYDAYGFLDKCSGTAQTGYKITAIAFYTLLCERRKYLRKPEDESLQ